ncbi:hypothetical protein BDN70DRAFT_879664 [Pholiota conissans]|uniref:Uncharacterized protein n=1 Tax=Pholiota conissans TaxID=109636 RepID=A0A9P5YZL6_9AGAR|nr:hypothetical protein BDN70DRAFT_879664 [Pholiota conissans]
MPPRFSRVYHMQVKTHKLTIMLSGLAPPTQIAELKSETLSALKSDISHDTLDVKAMEPPEIDVETVDDFELCRAVKEKGKPTGQYEVLPPTSAIRDFGLAGWDTLYLQFRDRATGELMPITFTLPLLWDDDDGASSTRPESTTISTTNKGKRKADDLYIEETAEAIST